MKPTGWLLLMLTALFFLSEAKAQHPGWDDPTSLPQWMTPEEELRRHEIGKSFVTTDPPLSPVRSIAEFERLQGGLIRYPLGIPLDLVAAMSEQATVYTLVSSWDHDQAINAYTNAGVNMDNAEFIIASTNSYWTRDYGPWFVADGDHGVGIVDFPYNRPRPADDAVPEVFASFLGVPRYGMDVVHTGGNFMSDGLGVGASTDLVYEENSGNESYVHQQMEDFMGINDYHVTIDAQGAYIQHIDTWAKFLDVDKILIAEVPESHHRYWAYELVADYFAGQTSSYGTPFEVIRVYAPNGEPYTNALILNERVYVPVTGSDWDNAALETYEQAMPGYDVLGFEGSWQSTDALHCRVKDIADTGMLYIEHIPLHGEHEYQQAFEIHADIIPYSGEALYADSLFAIYKVNQGEFDTIPLTHVRGHTYSAMLPAGDGDTEITYYLSAADASGRKETWPLIGAPGARTFSVAPPPGFTVSFAVKDPDNEPITNATIVLDETENAPGDYVFEGVLPGSHDYHVSKECFLPAEGQLTVTEGDKTKNVTLSALAGDANGDGEVDVLDVIAIMYHYIGSPPEPFCEKNADVNGDGMINVLDMIATVSIYMNGRQTK